MAAATDTGDKTFDCALVSVLNNYSGPLDDGKCWDPIKSVAILV